ncbi:MAG TPA: thioesterase [Actinobacteria bacterium]|nr:thioesterase [Actinomycetota bacterium]HDK45399.1 thioesterase [Actinomycetota bacterium]
MQWIETHRDVVYPWQCDHMGHLNVMYYTAMFDRATWHLFSSVGFTGAYLRTQDRGMAAVQSTTSYRSELVSGDLIVIRSRFLEVHERKARFEHEMTNLETGEIAATSELVGVHIDRTVRKACAIPEEIRSSIEKLISGESGDSADR